MDKAEAEKYLSKRIRLILTNGFHYSGDVISLSDSSLYIKDRFGHNVNIRLDSIMIMEETA